MTKAELEKEAEKYLDEKCKDCYMCSYDEHKDPYRVCQRRKDRKQAYLAGAEPREKRITTLEKKNAELKEINEGYCRSRDRLISIGFPNFKDCKEYADQLTNAKEIISEYINILKGDTKNWKKTQEKAEQFLKDSEVEKDKGKPGIQRRELSFGHQAITYVGE